MKTELIAEIGQAHDGSLGIAHSYIAALATLGVNTIKWQHTLRMLKVALKNLFELNFPTKTKLDLITGSVWNSLWKSGKN